MPYRPRSHQLEDESRAAFRTVIPKEWVVRDKSHDYGIDLEVEVFGADGKATGLIFLVQLKATDATNAKSQRSVRLPTNHLRYYASLDSPVLIFRWVRQTNKFFFRWVNHLYGEYLYSDKATLNVAFGDEDSWNEKSADEIVLTIRQVRAIEFIGSRAVPLQVSVDIVREKFNIETLIWDHVQNLGAVRKVDAAKDDDLLIESEITSEYLELRLGVMFVRRVSVANSEGILPAFLYCLSGILYAANLRVHAQLVARDIVSNKFVAPDSVSAFRVARALFPDLSSVVDVALLNNLQAPSEFQLALVSDLYVLPHSNTEFLPNILRFFRACILSARRSGDAGAVAAMEYNVGKVLTNHGSLFEAVVHFNRARKSNPEYLERSYFRRDLAGCLFEAKKYRCAKYAYGSLDEGELTPSDILCVADSLLLSGNLEMAMERYRVVADAGDPRYFAESQLRYMICHNLIEQHSSGTVPVREGEAGELLRRDGFTSEALWMEIISGVDAFNSLCAFNLGIAESKGGRDYQLALRYFLTVTIRSPGDVEAWGNAVISALNISSDLAVLVLRVALTRVGGDVYRQVRPQFIGNLPDDLLGEIDGVVISTLAEIDAHRRSEVRIRISDGKSTVAVDVPVQS